MKVRILTPTLACLVGLASPAIAAELKVQDVFNAADAAAFARPMADAEMAEMRGGLGLAFSVLFSTALQDALVETNGTTTSGGAFDPNSVLSVAGGDANADAKIAAFFGNTSGFAGIFQNIQIPGNNVIATNMLNIQIFLVNVTDGQLPPGLSNLIHLF